MDPTGSYTGDAQTQLDKIDVYYNEAIGMNYMTNGLQDLNSRTLYTNNDGIAPVPLFKRLHRPCLCTILVTRFWPPKVKNMIPEFYGFSGLGRMIIHI